MYMRRLVEGGVNFVGGLRRVWRFFEGRLIEYIQYLIVRHPGKNICINRTHMVNSMYHNDPSCLQNPINYNVTSLKMVSLMWE